MIGNLLIHREFTSAIPGRFIIEKDRIFTDNANKAINRGVITLQNLRPIPKNPIIANFFHNIGRADELGSGVRTLYRYVKIYSGAEPIFDEGDIFTLTVPLNASVMIDGGLKTGDNVRSDNKPDNKRTISRTLDEAVMEVVRMSPGINRAGVTEAVGRRKSVVAEAIARLKAAGKIEHRGSKKTGGYFAL